MTDPRPLIMHVVYRFDTGGLENGVVNVINRLPHDRYRHAVLALTTRSAEFWSRIEHKDVEFIELNKPPGHAVKLYPELYRIFRDHAPAIVHTRNLAALEAVVPARAAGVPIRIHGEHGWDVSDPDGASRKYSLMRRLYRPFVTRYVVLSRHLEGYLKERVRVPAERITRICNGVDTTRFLPAGDKRDLLMGSPFNACRYEVVGTVGRLDAVKDQMTLLRAFALLLERAPNVAYPMRLIIVGEGPMRGELEAQIGRLGLSDKVWLAGARKDIPDLLRAMDIFALPSRAEGISNTILEAMACGLPVVATDVGGNGELVVSGETGLLVPSGDAGALAEALARYALSPTKGVEHGNAGRRRVENLFSLDTMIAQYQELYDKQLRTLGR